MGILEYRTMYSGSAGDDPETDFGMIGHGVTGSDTGCPMPIAGSDIGCLGGVPGHLVLNRKGRTIGEGGKG